MTTKSYDGRLVKQLAQALKDASDHLDYCGYGDKWERECAQEAKLEQKITAALSAVTEAGITVK